MERIICFALGNIYRWMAGKNRAELIKYVKQLDVRGVELTLGRKEELYAFKLKTSQAEWLRSLDYVSIHAPFRLVRNSDSLDETLKQLDIIQGIYQQVKAQTVIVHPNDLPPKHILDSYSMNFSTENLPPKRHITIPKLRKILKAYPEMGLCLDVAHAYLWSKHETQKLVNAFRNRITQVHFSGTYKRHDHLSLTKVSRDFIKSIEPVKSLDVPIVIEESFVFEHGIRKKSIGTLRKEVGYIKSLL